MMMIRRVSDSPAPSPTAAPTFPLYLLPSLRIPFRRHRISDPPATATPSSPPPATSPPPLSTSPGSPSSPPTSPLSPTAAAGGRRLSRTHPSTLRCSICSTDLAFHSQIISKSFHGRHGRAYLVSPPSSPPPAPSSPLTKGGSAGQATELINTRLGRTEDRHLTTGPHKVADVSCVGCGVVVGWKYIEARSPEQMYKEGKFILETRRVVGFHSWEDADFSAGSGDGDGEDTGMGGYHGGVGLGLVSEMGKGKERRSGERRSAERRSGESGGSYDEEDDEEEDDAVVFDSEDEDECDDIFAGVWDPKVAAERRRSRIGYLRASGEMA